MLVYLFVPVVLAGVFFFLNLVNKGSSQQAIAESNATATKQQRPKKQTKSTRKPAATNAASKDTKDVTLNNVEEEVDIRELHAVQTRRQTSSLASKEETKKEEAKEVKPAAELKQPVVESSKKKKKNDGFQVVTKPEVTGRPQKPKREDSESTPTDEGASTSKSAARKNNKKGGKKGDKKEVEKKDPNKSIYKSLTPVTPTASTVEETEKKEASEEKPDENATENKEAKKEKKQRAAADKDKQPRKPRRENVIVTNPYKDVDDFWSDEPVKPAVTASQPVKAQSEPVKKSAKKTKKSPVSSKQDSGVVIVGSEVNPWANVGSVSETSDEAFPKLGEQPKRSKKVAAKQAQLEDEEEEEEAKNPHKRESETHFEVQYEAPYEKKAKLNDEEEEEEGLDVVQVATEDAAEL